MKFKPSALVAALVFTATSSIAAQTVVGLITKTETNPFFVKMKEGAQAEAKKLDIKLITASGKADGDTASQITALENCLQKNPDINVIYTINEPAAAGAFNALQKAKKTGVTIVSVDGGCQGIKDTARGVITATSQQYLSNIH